MSDLIGRIRARELKMLEAMVKNPAFASLNDPAEDIYTLEDGEPFNDPELADSLGGDQDGSITDPEEDIYTLEDGEPFQI